jgi:xanthine dehydrogenase/oxidase
MHPLLPLCSLQVGGSVTLTALLKACKACSKTRAGHEVAVVEAIAHQLKWFAGTQIRNVATLAGNIVTGSPISDLNPIWVATGAWFMVKSAGGKARSIAAVDFFLGYRCGDIVDTDVGAAVPLHTRGFQRQQSVQAVYRFRWVCWM